MNSFNSPEGKVGDQDFCGLDSAISIVLGESKFDTKVLTIEQWSYIIKNILMRGILYLKYLPMFRPLGEGKICFPLKPYEKFKEDDFLDFIEIELFIPGRLYKTDEVDMICQRTKCFGLAAYAISRTVDDIETVCLLMISDSGKIFCVEGTHDLKKKSGGRKYTICDFSNLDINKISCVYDYKNPSGGLSEFLKQFYFNPTVGAYVLKGISSLFRQLVEEKRRNFNNISKVQGQIESILKGLDFSGLNPLDRQPGCI